MSDKNNVKTALLAELLGDLDSLLSRVEALPERISQTAAVLDASGDKYRQAVADFTDRAKQELSDHQDRLNKVASNLAALTVEEQKKTIQDAAKAAVLTAFRAEKVRTGAGWIISAFLVGCMVGAAVLFVLTGLQI